MSEQGFNIKVVLEELKQRRKFFSSEADFQLALATQIEKKYGENSVICEYVPDYTSIVEKKESRIHIDILYRKKNIPIELKYRTKKAELCEEATGNYLIRLTDQGAHDEGSYGFWRDVCRVGEYKRNVNAPKGYVVFLTNDEWYKNPDYSRCRVVYDEFALKSEYHKDRCGMVSNKQLSLRDIPEINAYWMEWDMDNGFWCYVAEV